MSASTPHDDDRDLPELDWAALGDAPFDGEQEDDALLHAVLADVGDEVAPPANDPPSRAAAWGLIALVALAAGVLVFLWLPKSWLGFEAGTDVDSLAPDTVEAAPPEQEAKPRVHARAPAEDDEPLHAVLVDPPVPEPAPPQPADAPRSRTKKRAPPPQPSATADDLLRRAQDTLARGDRGAALVAYQALVDAHPRSAEARAAQVSIGRLHLRAGRAKAALQAFDRYLATPRGALRQEARYGRLQALRKQDAANERDEIEAFMTDFPRSLYTGRLQTRLGVLP